MKKNFLFLVIILIFTSCATTKRQRMERDMFDPKQTHKEKKMEKRVEGKTNKSWTKMPKRK